MKNTLRITEIFFSLQGESARVGLPTTFVRLTGCPLRCHYCDTAYAFSGGSVTAVDEIYAEVATYPTRYVTVTGGEPMAQLAVIPFLTGLCDRDYLVSLETGGAIDLSEVDARVMKVVDLKTPGSGEQHRNLYENLQYLNESDQVKFVICDRADYQWACEQIERLTLNSHCEILFSPSSEQLPVRELADWILEDGLPVRMQVQLHKQIWGNVPGK
jgi:7-carboxy-7-deazaguanine synthase